MSRSNGSEQQDISSGAGKTLAEFGSGAGVEIEPVTNMDSIELEKFMHEDVVVYIHKTKEKGSLECIVPNVNGKNQPIFRGVNTVIKRKYVEALISGHAIDYEQQINQNSPDQFKMVKKATPSYPFDVIKDTAKGRDWKIRLEHNLAAQA